MSKPAIAAKSSNHEPSTQQAQNHESPPHRPKQQNSQTLLSSSEIEVLYLDLHDPRAAQFDIGADEAMEALGIKRSRLTQISGRTLPCARIKIGRYVRPMYRHQDIENYRSRLRIPQSRAHAAQIIERTTRHLEKCAAELTASLGHESGVLSQSMQQNFAQFNQHQENQHKNWMAALKQIQEDHQLRWQELSEQWQQTTQKIEQCTRSMKEQEQRLRSLQQQTEISERQISLRLHRVQSLLTREGEKQGRQWRILTGSLIPHPYNNSRPRRFSSCALSRVKIQTTPKKSSMQQARSSSSLASSPAACPAQKIRHKTPVAAAAIYLGQVGASSALSPHAHRASSPQAPGRALARIMGPRIMGYDTTPLSRGSRKAAAICSVERS